MRGYNCELLSVEQIIMTYPCRPVTYMIYNHQTIVMTSNSGGKRWKILMLQKMWATHLSIASVEALIKANTRVLLLVKKSTILSFFLEARKTAGLPFEGKESATRRNFLINRKKAVNLPHRWVDMAPRSLVLTVTRTKNQLPQSPCLRPRIWRDTAWRGLAPTMSLLL